MREQKLPKNAGAMPANGEAVVVESMVLQTTQVTLAMPSSCAETTDSAVPAVEAAETVSHEAATVLAADRPMAGAAAEPAEQVTTTDQVLWITVIMLSMLAAFGPICTDIYLPAIPFITEQMHSDAATMQLSLTTSLLGLALGQLLIGPISDTYGRKKPLYVSLVLFVVSSIGCALAVNVPQLVTARFFQGLAGAGGVVLARTIACDLYKGKQLTKFMALLMAINSFAPILGPLLGSGIITFFPWPMIFAFLAVWGAVLLLGSFRGVNETLPIEKRIPRFGASVKDMLHQLVNLRFLLLAVAMAFSSGGFFAYLSASPFVFQRIFGLSPLGYSVVFGINAIAIAGFSQLTGIAAQKVAEQLIVRVAFTVQAVVTLGFILLVVTDMASMVVVAAILCVFVGMMGVTQTAGFSLVMESRSGGAGSASGIFGVLSFLFGALFSPLVGLMGEMSMVPLLTCMMVSCIAGYFCFVTGLRIKTKHDVEVNLQAPKGAASDTTSRPIFRKQAQH